MKKILSEYFKIMCTFNNIVIFCCDKGMSPIIFNIISSYDKGTWIRLMKKEILGD